MEKKRTPLQGVRVLDFSVMMAGHILTLPLAHFGAQVILVESVKHSRATRLLSRRPGTGAPSLTSPNVGHYFNKFNTNKLSLTLDLRNPRGLEIARRLVKVSDVVADNLRSGVMKSFGLGYEELVKVKPDIIVLSMPAMGSGGPYENFRSLSWNLQGMAGWNYASGYPDRPPINPTPYSHGDHSCNPFHAAVAVMAALCYKAKTGKGQFIELAQLESNLCFTETTIFEYLVNGRPPERMGNRLNYAAPHGVYRCKGEDRWCAISVFNQKDWENLCYAMEMGNLINDKKYRTMPDRLANQDGLDRFIEQWTLQRSSEEVMETLQKAGIAAGVVQNVEELVLRDPQLKARQHWAKVTHPEAGDLTLENWCFKLSETSQLEQHHAPLLGEHNDFVLREVLGMPEDEINSLIVEGVLD